ncbi:integrase, catalytic region, zinc finger, CCHC-type containing protein [Tanacetum coccineum]
MEYAPTAYQQQQPEFSQPDSSLVVPAFHKRDDLIDAINHMNVILNCRCHIPPGETNYFNAAKQTRKYTAGASGSNTGKQRTVICYNCKGEGHIAKQCTKPKRKRDETWFNDKVVHLVQARSRVVRALSSEEKSILAESMDFPDIQNLSEHSYTHNAAYQADDPRCLMTLIMMNSTQPRIARMANHSRKWLNATPEYTIQISDYDLFNQVKQINGVILNSRMMWETVQNSNSSAQQDVLILSMFDQLSTQVTHCTTVNKALTRP